MPTFFYTCVMQRAALKLPVCATCQHCQDVRLNQHFARRLLMEIAATGLRLAENLPPWSSICPVLAACAASQNGKQKNLQFFDYIG